MKLALNPDTTSVACRLNPSIGRRWRFPLAITCSIALFASCGRLNVRAQTDTPFGQTDVEVTSEPEEPEPAPYPASTMRIVPDASMVGMCVAACNEVRCGIPVLLQPGLNDLEIPGGYGTVYLVFFPWGAGLVPSALGDAASITSFHFLQGPWIPSLESENVQYRMSLVAASRGHAELRRKTLVRMHGLLLDGVDPGPLPGWIQAASFTSWRAIHQGSDAGGVELTCVKPGSQVDEFSLAWNGTPGYATLGANAVASTVGEWQIVKVVIAAEDVQRPSGVGLEVTNEYEILFATEVEGALTNASSLSVGIIE